MIAAFLMKSICGNACKRNQGSLILHFFEYLAALTDKPGKSMHRMLLPKGNFGMDNLAAIFDAIRIRLNVGIEVHTIELT